MTAPLARGETAGVGLVALLFCCGETELVAVADHGDDVLAMVMRKS